MAEEKIYLNKFTSTKSSEYGFGIYIKDVNALYEELKSHANPDGSIRLYVSKKKTADKYGNDGTVTLNTWKPDGNRVAVNNNNTQAQAQPQYIQPQAVANDDLPF